MNPFQSYAYGYTSPYNFPPEAPRTLEPMPVYSPRNAGYMGIYGTQPTREETPVSPGISSVIRGMQEGSAGEGDKSDPTTAGGTAVSNDIGTGKALSILGGTVAGPIGTLAGAALGTYLDAREMDAALAQQGKPSLTAGQTFSGFVNAASPFGAFGTPLGYSFVDQAMSTTPVSSGIRSASIDEAAEIQAAIEAADRASASLEGVASQMGGMSSSTPGADTLGDTGMYAAGGYVPGHSGGMDDDVPAVIDGKGPARLSSGEFVFDAATVAALGDGNNAAGARKLDGLRKAIRQKAYGHKKQPPKNYSVGDLVRMYDRGR